MVLNTRWTVVVHVWLLFIYMFWQLCCCHQDWLIELCWIPHGIHWTEHYHKLYLTGVGILFLLLISRVVNFRIWTSFCFFPAHTCTCNYEKKTENCVFILNRKQNIELFSLYIKKSWRFNYGMFRNFSSSGLIF